jgi:hypothetical protein
VAVANAIVFGGNGDDAGALFLVAGTEATMPKFTIIAVGSWRKILDRLRSLPHTEIEQCEARSLEAMLHWRDPAERLRTFRCRHCHTLADDNPASG